MPIANCIITEQCQNNLDSASNLIDLWANESKLSSEHMTINVITSSEQLGKQYAIMATLLLPSIWSKPDITSLQVGLAKALALHYDVSLDDIFISTSIIISGMVVESGNEVKW